MSGGLYARTNGVLWRAFRYTIHVGPLQTWKIDQLILARIPYTFLRLAETDSCQLPYTHYVISGSLKVALDNGNEEEFVSSDVSYVSPDILYGLLEMNHWLF